MLWNFEMENAMLKRLSALVAAGAFVALLVPAAQALTPAPLPATTDVITVAQGCGPGWHRGPYGRCRRNAAVVVRGPVVVGAPVVVGRPVAVCRSVRTAYGWRRVCR
jgi:hypothetical protein